MSGPEIWERNAWENITPLLVCLLPDPRIPLSLENGAGLNKSVFDVFIQNVLLLKIYYYREYYIVYYVIFSVK